MSRRICIACLAGVLASAAPAAAGVNYTSSETQYQGVLPEATAIGAPGGGTGPGAGGGATGTGGSGAGTTSGGAAGSGGNGSGQPSSTSQGNGSGGSSAAAAAVAADSATRPFSGGDILLAVLAAAGLLALGIVLRRSARREPASP